MSQEELIKAAGKLFQSFHSSESGVQVLPLAQVRVGHFHILLFLKNIG